MLKTAFTTNCENLSFEKSVESITTRLRNLCNQHAARLPYAMLQPRMANMREHKIVVLNGKALYDCAGGCKKKGKQFSVDMRSIHLFAESAVIRAKRALPCLIDDFLLRVDIFQNIAGDLIVNEFESLDADIFAPSKALFEKGEIPASTFMRSFWENKVQAFCGYTSL